MTKIVWEDVGRLVDEAARSRRGMVLSTHVNPDGDGLGSELGLYHHLTAGGARVRIINNDPVHRRYGFLPGADKIEVYNEATHRAFIEEAALFFVLDNSSPQRLGRVLEPAKATAARKVCIDHHVTTDPFWDVNCIDVDAPASGQLVYQMIKALGGRITPDIAVALYVSYVTDTGHFRFSKTTASVHRIIGELMDTGAINPPVIYRALFEGVSPGVNRLVAAALSDTHYEYGGRLAWARLTHAQLESHGGVDEDTGDLVNMLLSVEGVKAAALFKEIDAAHIKVSLRSLGDVDVHALASRLGGGGHRNASGVSMSAPLNEGVRRVVDGMKEVLGA